MKTFLSVLIVIVLMLIGFWYYMGNRCSEVESSNQLAIKAAVQDAIDSMNMHYALREPVERTHVFPKKEKKISPPKTTKPPSNVFVDQRDGQEYKTVEIAGETWMAENLNYKSDLSMCYEGLDKNCSDFGRLYTWKNATTVCPSGWHLPDDADWSWLINYYGGIWDAGTALKKGGESNMNILMAGYYDKAGFYGKIDESAYYWSSTEQNENYASFKGLYESVDNVGTYTYTKTDAFSVRCVKDK